MAKSKIEIPPPDHCIHKLGLPTAEEAARYVRNEHQRAYLCGTCSNYHIKDVPLECSYCHQHVMRRCDSISVKWCKNFAPDAIATFAA